MTLSQFCWKLTSLSSPFLGLFCPFWLEVYRGLLRLESTGLAHSVLTPFLPWSRGGIFPAELFLFGVEVENLSCNKLLRSGLPWTPVECFLSEDELDLDLPRLSGLEASWEGLNLSWNNPVLALSSNELVRDWLEVLSRGEFLPSFPDKSL